MDTGSILEKAPRVKVSMQTGHYNLTLNTVVMLPFVTEGPLWGLGINA